MLHSFHFLRPFWLLMLIPVAWLVWSFARHASKHNAWRQICDPHLLPHVLVKTGQRNQGFVVALLMTLWVTAVIAMAGPTWSLLPQPVVQSRQALMFVLDLSPAMLASDLKPNRLTRAKYKIQDILREYKEGLVGMVAFSGDAYTVSPMTNDANTLIAMLSELSPAIMPTAGHHIGLGLQKGAQLLKQSGLHHGTLLLITANHPTPEDEKIARTLTNEGYHVSVLGVGTKTGAPIPTQQGFVHSSSGQLTVSQLPIKALKTLAHTGQGHYQTLSNHNHHRLWFAQPAEHTASKHSDEKQTAAIWRDQGYGLVLLLLPGVLLLFRRGCLY